MNVRKMIAFASIAGAFFSLHADTYRFIISGYPAANESYAAESAATSPATSASASSAPLACSKAK